MVATVIAVIAVVGLAHAFGNGRALINRYEVARDALGIAQREMEVFQCLPLTSDSLDAGPSELIHVVPPVMLNARQSGNVQWTVTWIDDPVNGQGAPNDHDYKRLTVVVSWQQGDGTESVSLSRLFLGP